MISVQLLRDEGIAIIEPGSPLQKSDFEALAKTIDAFIEEKGSLNGLIVHTRTFPGWDDFNAFIQHVKFVKGHHQSIKRVAIVTDSKLIPIVPGIAKHFVSAEIAPFKYGDIENAKKWILEAT